MSTASHDVATAREYGERASAYVTSAVHAGGADLDQIEAFARRADVARALDLGCGGGHVTYRLAACCATVHAVDPADPMLSAVAQTARERGFTNVSTHHANAERLPFDDEAFDLVASRFSVHHWQDAAAGLAEARRVARRGARAIFVDVMAPESALLDTHLQTVEVLRDTTHVRDYTLLEWTAMLARARFAITGITRRRLRMEFPTWVARTHTPDVMTAAIRQLQTGAASEIQTAFAIEPDGSFTFDTLTLEAEAI